MKPSHMCYDETVTENEYFTVDSGNVHAIPVIHYTMEFAAHVKMVFDKLKPDCIAVELAETMQLQLLHAASDCRI